MLIAFDIQHSAHRPIDRTFKLFEAEDKLAWATFIVIFLGLLFFDNVVLFARNPRLTFRRALCYTLFYVSCALAFCLWVGYIQGPSSSYLWSSGYTLQWMMSFDNLFVFHLIFKVYGTPDNLKHRPLFLGILGAVTMTLAGLTGGEYVFHKLYFLHILFGLFFIYIGVSQALVDDEDDDPTQNPLIKWLQANFRFVSIYDTEGHFFLRLPVDDDGHVIIPDHGRVEDTYTAWETDAIKSGKTESASIIPSNVVDLSKLDLTSAKRTEVRATFLFLVVLTIEISDVIFSVDTIVAISSQVGDLYLAFSCVAFALLTLRATFFIVEVLAQMFSLMKYGIAAILVYIGIKLVIDRWVLVPHIVDCLVLLGVFGASFVASAIYDSMYDGEEGDGEVNGDVTGKVDQLPGNAEQLLSKACPTA
jgi:tellurite resistance protein TerC